MFSSLGPDKLSGAKDHGGGEEVSGNLSQLPRKVARPDPLEDVT